MTHGTSNPDHDLYLHINALRQRNLIFEKAFEASADGFLIVGRDGNILEINQAYCDYFGVRRQDVLGTPIQDLIPNTKMIEIMDKGLVEIDAIHEFQAGQTVSGERLVAVTRMPAIDNGRTIASVAIVKFSRYTLDLARTLRDMDSKIEYYRRELQRHGINQFGFSDLPSNSPSFIEAKKIAERFAKSELPILLLGETGVGKEVFANAIHHGSDRQNGPFVCVNCASIPADLLEAELFGYVEGAFTGSRRGGQRGKFEIANGGTLFLDEIGDMPTFMQSKLLRVLQQSEIEKLGSERTIPVNVRIIAATNQDLTQKLEDRSLRADLFYRINVLPITIPPLRERKEDIPTLAYLFLNELNNLYSRSVSFAPQTLYALSSYSWPGNVRELRNVVGRSFMMTEDDTILPLALPPHIALGVSPAEHMERPISAIVVQQERETIINTLRKYQYNCSRAAKALGIHRATLYNKMELYGIDIAKMRSLFDKN